VVGFEMFSYFEEVWSGTAPQWCSQGDRGLPEAALLPLKR